MCFIKLNRWLLCRKFKHSYTGPCAKHRCLCICHSKHVENLHNKKMMLSKTVASTSQITYIFSRWKCSWSAATPHFGSYPQSTTPAQERHSHHLLVLLSLRNLITSLDFLLKSIYLTFKPNQIREKLLFQP